MATVHSKLYSICTAAKITLDIGCWTLYNMNMDKRYCSKCHNEITINDEYEFCRSTCRNGWWQQCNHKPLKIICHKCQLEKPATTEYFNTDKQHGGLDLWCKECRLNVNGQ